MAIGVLALQGGFAAHAAVLAALGHEVALVRGPRDLHGLAGLVLPGGESTVHLRLLQRFGLEAPLCDFVRAGRPVLGTCAGLILLARGVQGPRQRGLGLLDVDVARNAWGRQLDSAEAVADDGRPLVFIRAPRIMRVGPAVQVCATLAGEPVLVRQGAITGATFHPELGRDRSLHAEVFGGKTES